MHNYPRLRDSESVFPVGANQARRRGLLGWYPSAIPRFIWIACLCLGFAACDRTDEWVRSRAEGSHGSVGSEESNASPRKVIDRCIAAYQRLSSYEDRAYVRLRYVMDGQPMEDRAPMSIAWQQDGPLALHVYSVRGGPSQGRWRLRIDREDLAPASQVLSRAIPKVCDFDWLLAEPALAQGLAAGLGGFPPQLDMLLASHPLQGLVEQATALKFEAEEKIDGTPCHVIHVERAGRSYRLYIDRASMLLRRLDLPQENLPAEMFAEVQIANASLSIEFEDIRLNREPDWKHFEVAVGDDDLLVNHFVQPIPHPDTEHLGERVPAFMLRAPDGKLVFQSNETGSKVKAAVLVWLADHPSCRQAAGQLAEMQRIILQDPQLKEAVQLIPIWAEPDPPEGHTFDSLVSAWQLPADLAIDREALGRDLFQIHEAPSLIVLDANHRIQLRETQSNPYLSQVLPAFLKRICDGEDLAASLTQEAVYLERRMRASIRLATSIDGLTAQRANAESARQMPSAEFMQLNHYPPVVADLSERHRIRHSGSVAQVAVGADYMLWILHVDGSLGQYELSPGGARLRQEYQTDWKGRHTGRLLVSPSSRYLALCVPGGACIEIYDLQQQQSSKLQLREDMDLVDVRWLSIEEGEPARLAAITSEDELILLDPRDREQLSGRCPSKPLALIQLPVASGANSNAGLVILEDRRVEPLQLSDDSVVKPRGTAVSFSMNGSEANSAEERKLLFQPAKGPWSSWSDSSSTWTLAHGWLAQDEPAVFLLDDAFQQKWHCRMPINPRSLETDLASVARDPNTGMVTWFQAGVDGTIHILRADGLTDHFRPSRPFVGFSAIASGQDLLLTLTTTSETTIYGLHWK